jgi:bla regulator protein BlaR1
MTIPEITAVASASVVAAIADHLWQSSVFAGTIGLSAAVLSRERAHIRHTLWVAASLKFLVPFSLLAGLAVRFSHLRLPERADLVFSLPLDTASQPFTSLELVGKASGVGIVHGRPGVLFIAFAVLWMMGFVCCMCNWLIRWRRMSVHLRSSFHLESGREVVALARLQQDREDLGHVRLFASDEMREPAVFGIMHPVLIWPVGASEHLSDRHIEAILVHECEHVRRRDNLAASMHMLVEAIFWFHPLIWWIGSRLVVERERACDEAVLRAGTLPGIYAESILRICEFCVTLPLSCISGVTGADLQKRIVEIMLAHKPGRLNNCKKVLLVAVFSLSVMTPIIMAGADAAQKESNRPLLSATIAPPPPPPRPRTTDRHLNNGAASGR